MTVRVTCPNPDCGNVADVEEQSLGKRGRCKKCGHVFDLARPDGEPASGMSGDASAWKKGSAPANPTDLPEQFGRYRIMRTLGQGGMGAVYLAHDTRLDRQVALKVPFFTPADGPQAVQRFEREARAAATLDHPNLCPIFDVGEVDGVHYLTMPYIEGKTLADAFSTDQTVTEAQAAAVIRKLALALQEAHDKGIIHRDLKPGNIMINRRREMIIMDFGLARMVGGDEALTRTGNVLGTALYMAPEQAAGDASAIGPAADVYSLGVILHELLTGRRPFEGPWSLVIGLKNVKDPDPPSKLRPGLSPGLEAICLKALAREPKDRYRTMAEFAGALETFLADSGSAPAPTPTLPGSSRSAEKPESLAHQVFAGLISEEVTSLREASPSARQKPAPPQGEEPRSPGRLPIIIGAAGAAVLLLVVAIYAIIGNGPIRTEANNPKVIVKINPKARGIARAPREPSDTPRDKEIAQAPDNQPDLDPGTPPATPDKVIAIEEKPPSKEPDPPATGDRAATPAKVAEALSPKSPDAKAEPSAPAGKATKGRVGKKSAPNADAANPDLPRMGLPADVVRFGNNYYKLFPELVTWPKARIICENLGGHLVIINNDQENEFIFGLLQRSTAKELWLGITDEAIEGIWLGVDGLDMPYGHWEANQPNNDGGGIAEHYGAMMSSGLWNDLPDHGVQGLNPGFVCEWEGNRPAAPKKRATPKRAAEGQATPPGSFTNSVGMKLVPIPAGEFTMGSDEREEERPPHRVRITRPFFLAAHEVTQAQYRAVTGASPSYFVGADDHPVETVSWLDAVRFCNELSRREKREPYYRIVDAEATILGGNGYRLPTEAEWEYACGDQDAADRDAVAWFSRNAERATHPIGLKRSNRRGLYDMLGNVWEWCQDGYDPAYFKHPGPPDDPTGPQGSSSHVVRGASWYDGEDVCRSKYRTWNWFAPKGQGGTIGFRIACSAAPGPNK